MSAVASAVAALPVTITLPDGATRSFDTAITGLALAESISKSLAKMAVLVKINGELKDLSHLITADCHVAIITRDNPEALETLRHDCAHVLAQAVQELFPGTQVTIGPAIENGFYYDFARDTPFTPDDFAAIEAKMREIVARDLPLIRDEWPRDVAIAYFREKGEHYKAELIESIPDDQKIGIYKHGNQWLDLCRGPHFPTTKAVGTAFKLMKVAGAYWRGDHRNAMLTRIYGTVWPDQKQLDTYLHQLEEAERRDHRRLGREMDLFHLQEEAVGSVFWHPNGWTLWRTLENYIRDRIQADGYVEVRTPQLIDRVLWEKSGHWDKFRANMFTCAADEDKVLAIKPMNCPAHVQIFKQGLVSYRDLPLRMAEFGCCHRNEPSGALHGIMRVRQMTQDDAHIFCSRNQIVSETQRFCNLLQSVYADLGFTVAKVYLSTRPELRAGDDALWDKAEQDLADACKAAGLEYEINPGEGAFYGPKLEFHLKDAIGRSWQCGTLQLDFVLPERLDAHYIGEDGAKHRPVMLHRAILGSMERFLGVLIEHYAGHFPLWLAPQQIVVAPIVSEANDYAEHVAAQFKAAGLRVITDLRNEKINYKIREHSLAKIPVIAVVGKREAEEGKVALRRLGGETQQVLTLVEAVAALKQEATAPHLR